MLTILAAHLSCVLLPEGSYVFVQGGIEGLLHGDQPTQSCLRPVVYVQSRPAHKHMSLNPEEEDQNASLPQVQNAGVWTAYV